MYSAFLSRYLWHPGATTRFLAVFFAYETGDGVVLMSNEQYSKALMLEVIQASPNNMDGLNSRQMIRDSAILGSSA